MVDQITYEPTGLSHTWAGLVFEQYQRRGGYGRTASFTFRLKNRPDVNIHRVTNFYRASIGNSSLPTKFREWETAAKAIGKALQSERA